MGNILMSDNVLCFECRILLLLSCLLSKKLSDNLHRHSILFFSANSNSEETLASVHFRLWSKDNALLPGIVYQILTALSGLASVEEDIKKLVDDFSQLKTARMSQAVVTLIQQSTPATPGRAAADETGLSIEHVISDSLNGTEPAMPGEAAPADDTLARALREQPGEEEKNEIHIHPYFTPNSLPPDISIRRRGSGAPRDQIVTSIGPVFT